MLYEFFLSQIIKSPMAKKLYYKDISTFPLNQGMVWSPAAYDNIHLSLIENKLMNTGLINILFLGLW